ERPAAPPEQEVVPAVGILVHRVEPRPDPVRGYPTSRVREARHVLAVGAAGAAGRDPRHPRIRTKIDVQLSPGRAAAGLLPHEALEVAAVAGNRVDVVPAPADLA